MKRRDVASRFQARLPKHTGICASDDAGNKHRENRDRLRALLRTVIIRRTSGRTPTDNFEMIDGSVAEDWSKGLVLFERAGLCGGPNRLIFRC